MSKNMKRDDEWEDCEKAAEEDADAATGSEGATGEDEEDEDTSLNNSDVVVRYKKAALWCNETLQVLIAATKPGAKVHELCKLGDDTIAAKLKTMFKGTEKGVGFPTCISLNQCVCHNSPGAGDEATPQEVKLGDVVHYDLGVQVDGYCAQVAHTLHVTESGALDGDARVAHIIAAAYSILQTAQRKMRPGVSTYEVTEIIEKAAEHYKVTPVEGVLSHMLKRYIVDSARCIAQRKVPEQMVHEYEFEKAQVWTLDIVMSTGKGKLRERDARPCVYKAALDSNYMMKMESARELQKEIEAKYGTFPFALRALETKKARLGLSEMVKHDAVVPYPVLYERDGEVVAHFKTTMLVGNKKLEAVTGLKPQAGAPALEPFSDELLIATSKLPYSLEDKKGKKKADGEATATASS